MYLSNWKKSGFWRFTSIAGIQTHENYCDQKESTGNLYQFNKQVLCKYVSLKGQHGGTEGSSGYCLCV